MKPINLITVLLFIAGTAWCLSLSPRVVRSVQHTYYNILSPVVSTGSTIGQTAAKFGSEVEHSRTLEAKLEESESSLKQLRAEIQHLRQLEEENLQLRAALNFQKRTKFQLVPANIIRRHPSTWWQTSIIDRGQEHHIGVQLPVITAAGLVGKIDRPDATTSVMILLTDEKCQVSAKIQGTREVGILSGSRVQMGQSPTLRLRYLSKDAKIKPGARVITTGQGGLFPANIALGTITSIERGAIAAEALVKPAVDFASLETVFVLTGRQSP